MSTPNLPPSAPRPTLPRAAWIAFGAIGTLIVVLLAAVLYKLSVPATPPADALPATAAASAAQASPGAMPPARSAVAVAGTLPAAGQTAAFPPLSGARRDADGAARPAAPSMQVAGPTTGPTTGPGAAFQPQSFTRQASPAPACADCGTVVAVQPVQEQGRANGVGAVVGGLVGGLLGNQIGAGNGRTAATLVGAVGGGFAGNEVQKRIDAKTVYRVRIRMDDGATRVLTLSNAPPVGQRVRVQANGALTAY